MKKREDKDKGKYADIKMRNYIKEMYKQVMTGKSKLSESWEIRQWEKKRKCDRDKKNSKI